MNRKFIVMAFIAFSSFCFAKDDWKSMSNEEIISDKTIVLKSMNSNICHSFSSFRNKVKIVRNAEGIPVNAYPDLESCLSDEGKVNKYEVKAAANEDPVLAEEMKEARKKDEQEKNYAGLNWGAGLMFASYSKEIVIDASLNNGVVSVNHELDNRAIAMIESHFFYTPGKRKVFGVGPFIGVGLAGENGVDPLSIYGGGVMVGFRKPNSSSSWNVGLGYFIDTDAKLLKKGLKDGDSTTETDSAKIFIKDDIGGVMLMFSSSF